MVWAACKVDEKPILYVIDGNIDSEVYKKKVLMRFFADLQKKDPDYLEKTWYYQQDGARAHTSHKSL